LVKLLRIYAIGMMYAMWMLKNKLFYIYLTLFFPISILIPFYLITPEENRPYVAIGTIVLTLLSNSLVTACQDLAMDKLLKRIAVILTTPVTPIEYFLGQVLSNALQTFPAITTIVLTLYIVRLLNITNIPLFIAGLTLGWYLATSIGFIIAVTLRARDYQSIVIVSNVIAFILVFLVPIYYPPTHLPGPLRNVAIALPTLHIANLLGLASNVNYYIDLTTSIIYLAVLTSSLTFIVSKRIKFKDLY